MADIANKFTDWNVDPALNQPVNSTPIGGILDDNLRTIQSGVRRLCSSTNVAAVAGLLDLNATDDFGLTATAAAPITSLGAMAAGVYRWITFAGVYTLTHSANLICPTGANITTALNDTCRVVSRGGGIWHVQMYQRANGAALVPISSFSAGTVALPGLFVTGDPNTGFYSPAADTVAIATNGVQRFQASNTGIVMGGLNYGANWAQDMNGGNWTLTECAAFLIDGDTANGGSITMKAGQGAAFSLYGADNSGSGAGLLQIQGGSSSSTAGAVTVKGGASTGGGTGGALSLYGGDTASGIGGALNLYGGVSASGVLGGGVNLYSGYGTVTGAAIKFVLRGTGVARSDVEMSDMTTGTWLKWVGTSNHLHVVENAGAYKPAITANGGTGPTIRGTDLAFEITVGTGGVDSSVTVTFKKAWATAPLCIAQHHGAHMDLRCVASTTTVQIFGSAAFTVGGKITVMCIGVE